MFLDPIKIKFRQIGFRLWAGFCFFFILCLSAVFFIAYSLLQNYLIQRDHELIESKLQEYAALYSKNGLAGLKKIDTYFHADAETPVFLIRLENQNHRTIFLHTPLNPSRYEAKEVDLALQTAPRNTKWIILDGKEDDDQLEILTTAIDDSTSLQVGKSTDDREDLLEELRNIFTTAFLILSALAAGAGLFFSHHILAPVRQLIRTIQIIQAGDMKARVPEPQTDDELQTLAKLFNQMLDQIQALINGMRETQDNLAHDLRTPMTRFRNLAEKALLKDSSVETAREALSEALEGSHSLLQLFETIMQINETEAGAAPQTRQSVAVKKVFEEVVDLYEMSAGDHKLQLQIDCPPETMIHADRSQFKRVISNLVDNAIKYSKPEGGAISLTAKSGQGQVLMSVRDHGIGISPADLPRVWDRFYRGDHSRSLPGAGLGLSLVQSIVKAHAAQIEIQSLPGQGSRFCITWPTHPS